MQNNSKINHLGIIMDGNRRWARENQKIKSQGHEDGVKVAKKIVKACCDKEINYLSLYVFSTENWARIDETPFLMSLIIKHLKKELEFYKENEIKINFFGRREPSDEIVNENIKKQNGIPKDVLKELDKAVAFTKNFSRLNLALCINYGGLDEIQRAHKKALQNNDLDIFKYLDSSIFPPMDLLIRTSGEYRLSNFLPFLTSYSELYFEKKYWPDFLEEDLDKIILEYNTRKRNYGK